MAVVRYNQAKGLAWARARRIPARISRSIRPGAVLPLTRREIFEGLKAYKSATTGGREPVPPRPPMPGAFRNSAERMGHGRRLPEPVFIEAVGASSCASTAAWVPGGEGKSLPAAFP